MVPSGARRAWLWALAWCGPALLVASFVMLALPHRALPSAVNDLENTYPNVVFGAVVPLLGTLILTRVPRHPLGWLFLGCGLASATTLAIYAYAEMGHGRHHLPGALAAAWISEWVWGLGLIPLVTLGILLFPDGVPAGRWWRLLLYADLLAVALVFVSNAFHPGRLENHPYWRNPLGLPLPRQLFDVLGGIGMALFFVGLLGGAVSAVLRWRRGDLRGPMTWFALSAAALALAIALPLPSMLGVVATLVAIPLVPLSAAATVLRHRLYGIEVVVRRGLVFAGLTVALLLVYAGTVAALGALLRGRAGSTVALVATALVAVAFAPVRDRTQRFVDRMLYGDRSDPYAVLAGLGRRLDDSEGIADPLGEVAATVASSLRLPYVRVEVARPDGPPLTAESGTPATDLHEVPLRYRGECVGRLLVAPRTPRDPFRAADLRLLEDLGSQVGVAAHAMLLAEQLQRSREGLVATREEERRRIRRDLHDGLGPALAGVALGLDAVRRLGPQDPAAAAGLVEELKTEVQTCLADVRRLVEDLRPPALDQLGLVGAVRQQAQRITERDPGLAVAVEADGLPALPAAVEVAAYRIATEALNNVSRHARARSCRVLIEMLGAATLRVEVEDDGVGLPSAPRAGVGLGAMRERAVELGGSCETGPAPRGGTRVAARIPVVA